MACRLCLRIFQNDSEYSKMAQHHDQEFLVNFLFEVLDMEITTEPLICTNCMLFTEKIHKFLEDCLSAQNRLYDYIRDRGLVKLSNDDLVHIAKEQEAAVKPEPAMESPNTDVSTVNSPADEYIAVSTDGDQITSETEDIKPSDDPNVFQYVIAVAEDGTVCNEVTISQSDGTILSKPSDISIEMMQYDPDSDITETCTSEEIEVENINGHILGPKLGYPDTEVLTDIVVYDQEEDKTLDFNHSTQTLLRDNPTIGVLDSSEYGKIDPKMFECSTDLEVLDFQPKGGMFDVEHTDGEMFTEILDYDERMSSEMLVYHDDMEKIGTAESLVVPEGAPAQPEQQTGAPNGVKSSFESCVCDQCGLPFKNKRGLMSHVIQKHKVERLKCRLCGFQTNYKSHLEKHMKLHHNETADSPPPPKQQHNCPHCPYHTPRKDTLHYHVKFVHGRKGDLETLHCHLCDYHTVRKKNLTAHVRYKHNGAELEKLRCAYCSYETVVKNYLRYHMRYHHGGNGKAKTHQCPHCDYKTYKEDSLARHLEQEHPNGDNPKFHECSICGYRTVRKASLKLHVKCRHRRDEECETLRCPHCAFQTHRRDAHRKHVRFVHGGAAGELPVHRCRHCRYQTVRKLDFRRHVRSKHQDEDL